MKYKKHFKAVRKNVFEQNVLKTERTENRTNASKRLKKTISGIKTIKKQKIKTSIFTTKKSVYQNFCLHVIKYIEI